MLHDLRESLGTQREHVRLPLEDAIADRILQIEMHLTLEIGIGATEACRQLRNDLRIPHGSLRFLQQLQYGVHQMPHKAILAGMTVQRVGGTTSHCDLSVWVRSRGMLLRCRD